LKADICQLVSKRIASEGVIFSLTLKN